MIKVVVLLLCLMSVSVGKDIYNYKKSYITPITSMNFKNQIQKIRETTN